MVDARLRRHRGDKLSVNMITLNHGLFPENQDTLRYMRFVAPVIQMYRTGADGGPFTTTPL